MFADEFLAQFQAQGGDAQSAMRQLRMQTGIIAGQVNPTELTDILKARTNMPGIDASIRPQTEMFNQMRALPAGPSGGYPPGRPAQAPTQIIPTTNDPFTAGPAGSTGVRPGTAIEPYRGGPPAPLASQAATGTGVGSVADDAAKAIVTGADDTVEAAAKKEAAKLAAATGDEAAAATGRLGSLNASLNKMFPNLGAKLSMGSIVTGLGVAFAGLQVSGFIDARNFGGEDSNLDQGLTGGIAGAGIGAGAALALGLSAGPVGWAALGGAALFGVAKMFQGKKSDAMNDKIDTARGTIESLLSNPAYGVDAYTAQQVRMQFEASTKFLMDQKNSAGLDQYLTSLASTVPTFLMQAAEKQQAVNQRMQLQASFGPVYSAMMERSAAANQRAFDAQMQAANQVSDPNTSAMLRTQAAERYRTAQDLQAAYARQVAGSTTTLPAPAQAVQDQFAAYVQQSMGG